MAFVVTALSDYVQENEDLIRQALVIGAPSIQSAAKQYGIKGTMNLNYLNTNPVFQNGASCGWNASGNATFTKRALTTGDIKVNMEFCDKDLRSKWTEKEITYGTEGAGLPFAEEIIGDIVNNTKNKMEKAVWQGDTSSSDEALARFNGWLKILGSDSAVHAVSISSGASAWTGLQAVYAALPEEVKGGEEVVIINVSPAIFEAYAAELVNANLYHYSVDGQKREIGLPGANAIVRSVLGLAGSLKVVATPDSNRVFGTDDIRNMEEFGIEYERRSKSYSVFANWNAGVQVYFPDNVALGTFAATPSAVAGVNAALADIAASAATLASTVNEDAQIETHANS